MAHIWFHITEPMPITLRVITGSPKETTILIQENAVANAARPLTRIVPALVINSYLPANIQFFSLK